MNNSWVLFLCFGTHHNFEHVPCTKSTASNYGHNPMDVWIGCPPNIKRPTVTKGAPTVATYSLHRESFLLSYGHLWSGQDDQSPDILLILGLGVWIRKLPDAYLLYSEISVPPVNVKQATNYNPYQPNSTLYYPLNT